MDNPLIYADICAGISAATAAWKPLGWRAAFYAEVDKFPCAVLAHHYPETPNLGDMTRFEEWPDARLNVLIGGTPCQGFSVAGLRKGLDDDRSNLALCFGRIAQRYRPTWIVWENVPGVRSSDEGRDLGAFLRGLAELGYGLAWRSLDAQYAGLAQRRERLFVVGHLGDWRPAFAVLSEPESLRWHPAPRREAGQGATPILEAGARTGVSTSDPRAGIGIGEPGDPMFTLQSGKQHAVAYGGNNTAGPINIATAVNAHGGPCGRLDFESETFVTHALTGEGFDASEDGTGRGTPLVPAAFNITPSNSNKDFNAVSWAVRRLTPRECERLQGFPDDYTRIPWRGKPAELCPDGHRYKALGNSIAVPCLSWIGERIALCESVMAGLPQFARAA